MKRILILLTFSLSVLFPNNSFKIHIGSCDLNVPKRYILKKFTPPYNFTFFHLEDNSLEELMGINFILSHNINIHHEENIKEKEKQKFLKALAKNRKQVSHKQYGTLEIYRFKPIISVKNERDVHYETTNIYLILNENFVIYIDETDPYIDDIHTMIEDCK